MYVVQDDGGEYEFYTKPEAIRMAEGLLDGYRLDAAREGEWFDGAEHVRVLKVVASVEADWDGDCVDYRIVEHV